MGQPEMTPEERAEREAIVSKFEEAMRAFVRAESEDKDSILLDHLKIQALKAAIEYGKVTNLSLFDDLVEMIVTSRRNAIGKALYTDP